MSVIIVLTTTPELAEAEALAESLVKAGLAACVQIMPPMTSVYVWEGAIQKEPENLVLIKTLDSKWEAIRDHLTDKHSYSIPEIVAIPANGVSGKYLEWMKELLETE